MQIAENIIAAWSHLYIVLHDKLSHQLDAVDSIDAKAATVFTLANAVVPVLAAVLVAERNLLRIVPVCIVAGLSGVASYQISVWMAGELITALNSNDRKLTEKARSLDRALVFLVLQVILGVGASLISIF